MYKKTYEEFVEQAISLLEPETKILPPFLGGRSAITLQCKNGHIRSVIPNNLLSRGDKKTCKDCTTKLTNHKNSWSSEDIEFLQQEYPCGDIDYICNKLNRTESAVRAICSKFSIQRKIIKTNSISLDTANNNFIIRYPNVQVIGYTSTKELAKFRCIKCDNIWEGQYGNAYQGISNFKCLICHPIKFNNITLDQAKDNIFKVFPYLEVTEYNGSKEYCTVRSSICGHSYKALYYNLKQGNSGYVCKVCTPETGSSNSEQQLLQYIKDIYSGWIITNDRTILGDLELDIVIPDLGIAVEFNGSYFHSDKFKDKYYHINKTNRLKEEADYNLIHVFQEDWDLRKDIVISRLRNVLGKTENKVFARKCAVKILDEFPREFLNTNHLQGSGSNTSINLGLYHNSTLISVMTFSKPRFTTKYDFELVRFCNLLGHTVVGGASKLFKFFRKIHPTSSIISYSLKSWGTGDLYKKLGFKYSHTSEPNYRYHKNKNYLSRYQCQKHLLKDKFTDIYSDDKTEYEIMTEAGYNRIYDCGSDVWIIP